MYQPAVAYLRRSTDRQEQSIGDQRKALERHAQEHGFDILDFYVDDAISGTSSEERKAFLKLIEDAGTEGCPWRYVLVYDIKRFGRLDNDEAGYYRFQLRKAGVEVVYISEGFNGDDTDDLLRPVKQWQARQESKELSKVTIRGLVSRSSGGWWSGGQPPYGYDLGYYSGDGRFLMIVRYDYDLSKQILDEDGNLTRVVPRGQRLTFSKSDRCKLAPSSPERVQTLRSIFAWYVHHGLGAKSIADRLNQQGIPSPRSGNWSKMHGDKWSMSTIREMLRNPAYVGDMVWNRLSFGKFHRVRQGMAVPRHYRPGAGPDQNRPGEVPGAQDRQRRPHLPDWQQPHLALPACRSDPVHTLRPQLAGLHRGERPPAQGRLQHPHALLHLRRPHHQGEHLLPALGHSEGDDRGVGAGADRPADSGLPWSWRGRATPEDDPTGDGGPGRIQRS